MQRTCRIALVAGFISHSFYLLGRGWLGDIFIPNAIPGWKKKAAALTIAGAALVFFISFSDYTHEMSFLRIGG